MRSLDDINGELMDLEPEEVEARVEGFVEYFGDRWASYLEEGYVYVREECEKMMEYLHTLMFARRFEEASVVLGDVRDYLVGMGSLGDFEWLVELLVDWNYVGLRFVSFDKDYFGEFGFYEEIIGITAGKGGILELRHWEGKLGLLVSYQGWLRQGGRKEKQEEAELLYLEGLVGGLIEEIEDILEKKRVEKDWVFVVRLGRDLGRYYFGNGKPNEGIGVLKGLLVDLEGCGDGFLIDLGDLNMEVGSVLAGYKKFAGARGYFVDARDIYEKLGGDFEVYMLQAEGWVEACDKGA